MADQVGLYRAPTLEGTAPGHYVPTGRTTPALLRSTGGLLQTREGVKDYRRRRLRRRVDFFLVRDLPALRMAIAIAWRCGLPSCISIRMFAEMAFLDFPFLSGMAFLPWFLTFR